MASSDTDPSSTFADAAARVASGANPHDEARSLVAMMTVEEKLDMLDGDSDFWPLLADLSSGGLQRHAFPAARLERLGIPGFRFADGPRGCVVGPSTAFPVAMARGATFDPELEERVGDVIGTELRAAGATYTGAVCMNLVRHPAWGRAQETYGEDPHHIGEMAAAFTRGLQRHVLACMKHFALNSMENARFKVDVRVDERALHEVYLAHFKRVAEEGIASVMSAYNRVNGEHCGENRTLLRDILRDDWGWRGFVTSDWLLGLRDPVKSVEAGLDIEMPARQLRAAALGPALEDGSLSEAEVDARVTDIVSTLLRFADRLERHDEPSLLARPEHRALAREVTARSIVLLRNEGLLLPVEPQAVRRLAVLGRLAAVPNLGDTGSSDVHPPEVITPLEGLRRAFAEAEVIHDESDVTAAADADLTVLVVGYTKRDEGEFIGGAMTDLAGLLPPMPEGFAMPSIERPLGGGVRGGDRLSLRLAPADEELIEAAARITDLLVVCVMGGSTVVMPWLERVPAVLHVWYPGMEGGAGIADVLTGAEEPGGRLPLAMPRNEDDLGDFDRDATAVTYDLFHGQWLLDRAGIEPHRPFGFGLGYTTFELTAASVEHARTAGRVGTVRASLANTGRRDGSTVVQVYGSLPESSYERPARRLIGFKRATLAAGTETTVLVPYDLATLAVRIGGAWLQEAGTYRLEVGQHAGDRRHLLAVELREEQL